MLLVRLTTALAILAQSEELPQGPIEAPELLQNGPHWLNYQFCHNEIWRYGLLFAVILVTLVVGRIVAFLIKQTADRLERKEGLQLSELLLRCVAGPLAVGIFAVGVYVSRLTMRFALTEGSEGLSPATYELWGKISQALIALAVAYFIFRLVDIVEHYFSKLSQRTETQLDDMLVPVIRKTLRVFITVVAVLFIGENILGMQLKAIIAAAGVGGLAIALAAKDTVSNFFGSVSIFADRPFHVGDRIRVSGSDGSVEEVGFRSTRIRTLDGHLVSMPNNKVANEMIENIARRPFIKRVANITITYDTPPQKVEQALQIIKDVLAQTPEANTAEDLPPRVFFNDFNDWALNILVIYWVTPPDYFMYLDVAERVNLQILRAFNDAGIEFAFPSQTLYLQKSDD